MLPDVEAPVRTGGCLVVRGLLTARPEPASGRRRRMADFVQSCNPVTHVAVSSENGSGPRPSANACSSTRAPMSSAGSP